MPVQADHSLTRNILLVEDHPELRTLISTHLQQRQYQVHTASTGVQALEYLSRLQLHALVLDLGLPDMDGMHILTSLKTQSHRLPCLVLTARDAIASRISALQQGADDYVLKPFDLDELEARLQAILRRSGMTHEPRLQLANLSYETATLQAWVEHAPLLLPRQETRLLEALIRSSPRILIKDNAAEQLYEGSQIVSLNAVEALVSRLRRKLQQAGACVQIDTVRGIGYRMLPR